MVMLAFAATAEVVIVNAVFSNPTGTVTEAGTTAFALFEDRLTIAPPVPAGKGIRTLLDVDDVPPTSVEGFS